MTIKRGSSAPGVPHLKWVVLVPLVLFGDVVLASLAWWMVGLIPK
jgi:hypothetical protein